MQPDKMQAIAERFIPHGSIASIRPFGGGLINDSYKVETSSTDQPDYLLQRINHNVFRDVDLLQENIEAVTSHIRAKLEATGEDEIERKVLRFIPTTDGKKYYYDGESYWRMMVFIPGSFSYDAVTPKYARHAGVSFGQFEGMLADLDAELGETIPDFHNMEFRLQQLAEAVAADPVGRVEEVRDLLSEIESRRDRMTFAERLHREGKLSKRICHCDTKINNMLFDEQGNVLCVVDLDTVMPSYVFSDYGDFLRTAANKGDEDDRDLSLVEFDMEIFKAFTEGYLESARSFLTPIEIENLPNAAIMFPYMQTVRFLADYINGDTYYKINYPEHNLVRAKAQFKLTQSVEQHVEQMSDFIRECLK